MNLCFQSFQTLHIFKRNGQKINSAWSPTTETIQRLHIIEPTKKKFNKFHRCVLFSFKPQTSSSPLVKGSFPLVFHGTACPRIRGRTISPVPVVDRIITGHKIFQPVLARVSLTKVALNASWKSDRGWTMENVPPATEKNGQRMKHERYFAWIFTRLTDIKHATVS